MPGLWKKRFMALIIDFLIITLLLWVIVAVIYPVIALLNLFALFIIWVPIAVILIIAYFTYFEGKYSTTPGKNVMKLKIRAQEGKITKRKALIRNLSKILWIPLIIDVIIGFALGKPRERYLDRLAKTEVIKTEEVERSQKNLEQSTS
jgi:uncharacterized RDD family membrane protein YckC